MNDKEKQVRETWIKLPKEVELALFLDGTAYLNPKFLPQTTKAITEYKMNKK